MTHDQPETISVERAKKLLQLAIDARGVDYVHDGVCAYADESGPLCMVGVALNIHGYPVEALMNENVPELNRKGHMTDPFAHFLSDRVATVEARRIFQVAQNRQDNQATWGEALRAALDLEVSYDGNDPDDEYIDRD